MRNQQLLLFALLSMCAHAQWLNFPTPGTPRTRDGKPNLAAPAPLAAEGHPDLSGVWLHQQTSTAEMLRLFSAQASVEEKVGVPGMELDSVSKYAINLLVDLGPSGDTLMTPAGAEMRKKAAASDDPADVCTGAAGIPLAGLLSEPFKIVQSPRLTVILYESDDTHRQIYTDGRGLPKEIAQPAFLGYSAGHWERDTLVVESAGFNDKTSLDVMGHPHSEDLHITERYHRRDFGHLDIETTFVDPKVYTKPFTVNIGYNLLADSDIFENFCSENEKDRKHLEKK